MPFKSQAQAKFMFAKHPKMAKEWADVTPSIKELPEKVSPKKRKKKKSSKAKKKKRSK